jgi:hypothetical protein
VLGKLFDRLFRTSGLRSSNWPLAQSFLRGYRHFRTDKLAISTKPTTVQSRVEVTIAGSPRLVFSHLIDTDRMKTWLSDVEWVSKCSDGPPGEGTTFSFRLTGTSIDSSFDWVEYEPEKSLSWNGAPIATGLGWLRPKGSFQIQPVYDASRLIAIDEPELCGFAKLLKPLLARSIKRSRSTDLARLKTVIEHDQTGPR